jgi:hypothetical protein
MKSRNFALLATVLVTIALAVSGCSRGPKPGDQSTPTLAYKALYAAVKKKDHEAIKRVLSKDTLQMMESWASMQKKTLNEAVENGLTETTFAPNLPSIRNEKLWGDIALLEVKNEKTGAWESLPFVKEDGNWKLAIDTFFKGTMSPTGPTNPEHPGQLPPGTEPGPPQTQPSGKPGISDQVVPPGSSNSNSPNPAPTPPIKGKKPGSSKDTTREIKPPTR